MAQIQTNPLSLYLDPSYKDFLTQIKKEVVGCRLKAALAVNKEVINLYWHIGKQILEKQKQTTWGDKLLDMLSQDLKNSFPETHGFSKTNLKYMRLFAQSYPDGIGQQAVDQLPWGHVTIVIRLKNIDERSWYIQQCIQNGWSRNLLEKEICLDLYSRQGISKNKITNYIKTLPEPHSLLAHDIIKNPYNFDCLGLHDDAQEREIEYASVKHITKFLVELGKGFAFLGNQVPVEVNHKTYFIDMLFYHVKLHSYFVVELKATEFKPEHTGKLNFYLSPVDDQFRSEGDNPSLGLLLCKNGNTMAAEYALRDIHKPIGVSEYLLTKALPQTLKTDLPTVEEIEAELKQ